MGCEICGEYRAIPIDGQILCEEHILEYHLKMEEIARADMKRRRRYDPITGSVIYDD